MQKFSISQRHLPNAGPLNTAIYDRFMALRQAGQARQTHLYQGRYENSYVALELIPQLQPVVQAARDYAAALLGAAFPLRYGFWFNEMGPGSCTSLHHHDEEDELLSACYYLRVPRDSGCFVAVMGEERHRIQPAEGMLLLFSPQLPHEVEVNRSQEVRLSVAFNFGPMP